MINAILEGYSINLTVSHEGDMLIARYMFQNPKVKDLTLSNSPYFVTRVPKSLYKDDELLAQMHKGISESFSKFTAKWNQLNDLDQTMVEQFNQTEAKQKQIEAERKEKKKQQEAIAKAAEELRQTLEVDPISQSELAKKMLALSKLDSKHSLLAEAENFRTQTSMF